MAWVFFNLNFVGFVGFSIGSKCPNLQFGAENIDLGQQTKVQGVLVNALSKMYFYDATRTI
jgi:hypothetical protein